MPGSLFITRPEYEEVTFYFSKWSEDIIKEAKRKNMEVFDLQKNKVTKKEVVGRLNKMLNTKMLVMFNAHGNESTIAGHDNEPILTDQDSASLHSKIVYARACSSAKKLGPAAVALGALAYIGYDIEFIFFSTPSKESRPLEDDLAALFLEPSNYVMTRLIKGHSATEANQKSREQFLKNAIKVFSEGPKSGRYFVLPYLLMDMEHQVCLGDGSVSL